MLHNNGFKVNKIAEDTATEYLGSQFILWLRLKAEVNIIEEKKNKKQRSNDYLTLAQNPKRPY